MFKINYLSNNYKFEIDYSYIYLEIFIQKHRTLNPEITQSAQMESYYGHYCRKVCYVSFSADSSILQLHSAFSILSFTKCNAETQNLAEWLYEPLGS